MTSMAAAWMSLVYGFGGMRSDGPRLSFRPTIPEKWNAYSFRLLYRGTLLELRVDKTTATFRALDGPPAEIEIYGSPQTVGSDALSLNLHRDPPAGEPLHR